jgi:hypothetical protein
MHHLRAPKVTRAAPIAPPAMPPRLAVGAPTITCAAPISLPADGAVAVSARRYQPAEPGPPLNGPTTRDVTHPP